MKRTNTTTVGMILLTLSLMLDAERLVAQQQEPGIQCLYPLTVSQDAFCPDPEALPGTVEVKIEVDELQFTFSGACPHSLYTIWIDHRNRATGELADDYQELLPRGALPRGVAPAFATTAGVFEGMRVDPNGIITDPSGNAFFSVSVDYNILTLGASPVVHQELDRQGKNRVGGHWMRVYEQDESQAASLQVIDPLTGRPTIPRSTAQGITIVRHPDFVTHGHTPGVGGVDHFPAFQGDFPVSCLPSP